MKQPVKRLLVVELCYRFLTGTRRLRELCRRGELGEIYAVELIFHNAYGPDKAWAGGVPNVGGVKLEIFP